MLAAIDAKAKKDIEQTHGQPLGKVVEKHAKSLVNGFTQRVAQGTRNVIQKVGRNDYLISQHDHKQEELERNLEKLPSFLKNSRPATHNNGHR